MQSAVTGKQSGFDHPNAFRKLSTRLLRQAVISTTNSLSHLSLAVAERTLQLRAEVSKLLREQYRSS